MKRRILMLLMVCILALSVSLPALAGNTTVITASMKEVTIQVTVPSTGQMYINPKRIPMNVYGVVESKQIISEPWGILNESNVPIQVNVTLYATPKGSIELSGTSVKQDKSGEKLMFLFLQSRVLDSDGDPVQDVAWSTTYKPDKGDIIITDSEEEYEALMVLAPPSEDENETYKGLGAFHVSGDVSSAPEEPWDPAKDSVTVRLVYTFTPVEFGTT